MPTGKLMLENQAMEAAAKLAMLEGFELASKSLLELLEVEIMDKDLKRDSAEYQYALGLTSRLAQEFRRLRGAIAAKTPHSIAFIHALKEVSKNEAE